MTTIRLDLATSALVIIDVQDRLVRSFHAAGRRAGIDQAVHLRTLATRAQVPILLTELEPRTYGHVLPALAGDIVVARHRLSAAAEVVAWLTRSERSQVVLAGAELHLAVLQTALDLHGQGIEVVVAIDATACRDPVDAELAVQRLICAGIPPTSVEAVVFEWADDARTPLFHDLIRQRR